MLSFSRLMRSFRYAGKGVKQVFREEHSFRVQIFVALLVLILSLYFKVKIWEAIILLIVVVMVLVLELINSVFERVVDILKPRMHPDAETIKDIMAAVVLISSTGAVLIGLLILGPYFLNLFVG